MSYSLLTPLLLLTETQQGALQNLDFVDDGCYRDSKWQFIIGKVSVVDNQPLYTRKKTLQEEIVDMT